MTHAVVRWPLVVLAWGTVAAASPGAAAQMQPRPAAQVAPAPSGDLRGVIRDDAGQPLAGAVVSILGSTTAFAVSDRDGQFTFLSLPAGPYLLRAHLKGYLPARGRVIQVDQAFTGSSIVELTRRADATQPAPVLAAGVGTAGVATNTPPEAEAHDHGEVAWRLRHLKRSVLKEAAPGLVDVAAEESFLDSSFDRLSRAVATSTRLASSLFAELPLSGQINFLTTTSFDRPQDLFSAETWLPRGVAFVSLQAPTADGRWTVRGVTTQGDLASWILAGSYVRQAEAHRYEAGLSYGMQRYLGGNVDALAAVADGRRNVGAIYAYDEWIVNPVVTIDYGAKYARYDYLAEEGLLSPRARVTLTPRAGDSFRVRATASRRAVAPGAEEFIPPSTGLWLPPERTFSPVSGGSGFTPEHLSHFEVAAERMWIGSILIGARVFRQDIHNQIVTLFGVAPPGTAAATVGHYYVASSGDIDARGWGLGVSRVVADGVRASVDYTRAQSSWVRGSPDAAALSQVASSMLRDGDQFHDVTTSVESVVPVTETRVVVVYKINTRFADAPAARAGTRFDVQLTQSLPFRGFAGAHWEMLVAVRNTFREELVDASVYDELLVLRPPKRVVGGVTVRF